MLSYSSSSGWLGSTLETRSRCLLTKHFRRKFVDPIHVYHSRTVKQDSRKSWQHQHAGSIAAQLQQRIIYYCTSNGISCTTAFLPAVADTIRFSLQQQQYEYSLRCTRLLLVYCSTRKYGDEQTSKFWGDTRMEYERRIHVMTRNKQQILRSIKYENESTVEVEHQH